jgi:hypothetical protein
LRPSNRSQHILRVRSPEKFHLHADTSLLVVPSRRIAPLRSSLHPVTRSGLRPAFPSAMATWPKRVSGGGPMAPTGASGRHRAARQESGRPTMPIYGLHSGDDSGSRAHGRVVTSRHGGQDGPRNAERGVVMVPGNCCSSADRPLSVAFRAGAGRFALT